MGIRGVAFRAHPHRAIPRRHARRLRLIRPRASHFRRGRPSILFARNVGHRRNGFRQRHRIHAASPRGPRPRASGPHRLLRTAGRARPRQRDRPQSGTRRAQRRRRRFRHASRVARRHGHRHGRATSALLDFAPVHFVRGNLRAPRCRCGTEIRHRRPRGTSPRSRSDFRSRTPHQPRHPRQRHAARPARSPALARRRSPTARISHAPHLRAPRGASCAARRARRRSRHDRQRHRRRSTRAAHRAWHHPPRLPRRARRIAQPQQILEANHRRDGRARKQTLVNAERFTSPELKDYERKVLEADERILEIERRLYREIRESIAAQASRLRQTSSAIAHLDVLANFARLAAERNYSHPSFTESEPGRARDAIQRGELLIAGGRHPVIETLLETRGERFVPNDLYLDDMTQPILIITGPNMGGKSTYLRQAALIVVMAQIGSFVPAAEARLPLVDRIVTRIGASENLARGRSTFLVEMSEVAAILNTATGASLILLDEVGRGTSTFDGLSIAWAVVEHLHGNARPRTLFATHYHELTELERLLPGVKNVHVSVREAGSEIIFLRRVEPGAADKSYGIEVARLAGLPAPVIERAREVLAEHEKSEHKLTEELSPGAAPPPQPVMFAAVDQEVLDALRRADLDNLKPLEALNLLDALKKQLS